MTTKGASVWVTRTQPGAETTAQRVRGLGLTPFIAPVLRVVFEGESEIDLAGVATLAFTSANGVRAFAARSTHRTLPVFTVGSGTARAAREAGFVAVTAGEGDVLALARSVRSEGLVLHAGAAEPAADLALALRRRGIPARGEIVYRTVRETLSPAQLTEATRCGFVLLHSARAARAFRALQVSGPRPVVLSSAIAQALDLPAVVARTPDEDALLAALAGAAV